MDHGSCRNGARVQTPTIGQRDGSVVRREFDVALIQGENRFEVRARQRRRLLGESEPGVLVVHYQQPLPKPELHLVAVGINRYADKAMELQFARSDATRDCRSLPPAKHHTLPAGLRFGSGRRAGHKGGNFEDDP